jgi:Fe-S-cluster containining protein
MYNNLASSLFDCLDRLWEAYDEIDSLTANFKKIAAYDCPKDCRRCCDTPAKNIEASIFEILPLSIHLWQKGEAESCLRKIKETNPESPCVFYDNHPSRQLAGGCRAYFGRPLVCRLFGFSATTNKYGKPLIVLCRRIKKMDLGLEDRIQGMIDQELKIPNNSNYAHKISLINPFLGQIRYSINEALGRALEMVGYRISLMSNTHENTSVNATSKRPEPPHLQPLSEKGRTQEVSEKIRSRR